MKTRVFMENILKAIQVCVSNISMPVGKNLLPSFFFSLIIFIVTGISRIFGYFTFIDWRGALIATLFLGFLCYLERRSNSDILRLNRTAQLSLDKVKSGKERLSSYKGFAGDSAGSGDSESTVGGRPDDSISDEIERYYGCDQNSTNDVVTEESDECDERHGH